MTVNGSPAGFTRKGQELTITPASGLRRNRDFTARIVYSGHVNNVRDPDHARDGWIPTEDGAYVVNEPQGTPSWLPVNDSLKDFATWDFTVTVPKGRTVVANGTLVSKTDSGDRTTWRWRETSPMVSYLATVTNGFFEVRTRTLANGLPEFNAVDPQTRFYGEKTPRPQDAWANLAVQPEAISFLSGLYGQYPFESVGGIVDWAPNVFFALETQTKPNYDVLPDELTIVHELAHQWFGDALVLDHWSDMWLNEGFATWSEWIWTERHGGQTAQQRFDQLYAIAGGLEARPGPLVPGARRAARAGRPVRHAGVRPRGDHAPGAAPEGRRHDLLQHPAHLVRREPLLERDDRGVHRHGRARERPAARPASSTRGCSRRAARPPGSGRLRGPPPDTHHTPSRNSLANQLVSQGIPVRGVTCVECRTVKKPTLYRCCKRRRWPGARRRGGAGRRAGAPGAARGRACGLAARASRRAPLSAEAAQLGPPGPGRGGGRAILGGTWRPAPSESRRALPRCSRAA